MSHSRTVSRLADSQLQRLETALAEEANLKHTVSSLWGVERSGFEAIATNCTSQRELAVRLLKEELAQSCVATLANALPMDSMLRTVLLDCLQPGPRVTATAELHVRDKGGVEEGDDVSWESSSSFCVHGVELTIVNVVCSFVLANRLDVVWLASMLEGARYDAQKFPCGVVVQQKGKTVTWMLLQGGNGTVTGAKSEGAAWDAVLHIADRVRCAGLDVRATKVRVNLVLIAAFGQTVDLARLAQDNPAVEYDSARFPGALWKMHGVTCLVYRSGNVVVTGASKRESVAAPVQELANTLPNYRTN